MAAFDPRCLRGDVAVICALAAARFRQTPHPARQLRRQVTSTPVDVLDARLIGQPTRLLGRKPKNSRSDIQTADLIAASARQSRIRRCRHAVAVVTLGGVASICVAKDSRTDGSSRTSAVKRSVNCWNVRSRRAGRTLASQITFVHLSRIQSPRYAERLALAVELRVRQIAVGTSCGWYRSTRRAALLIRVGVVRSGRGG